MRFRKDARLDPSQVEDYRGTGPRMGGPVVLGGGGGILTLVILLAVVLLGGNPFGGSAGPLSGLDDQSIGTQSPGQVLSDCRTGEDANQREDCRILAVVNSVQAYWSKTIRNYDPATTRFFTDAIDTGCGQATSAVGPFYCPRDKHVYIDLGFFDQLTSQLGARGGPLAEAYVLAHEYGHHAQDLLGTIDRAQNGSGPEGGSVRVELQADCFAGLWIGHALDTGFVENITRRDISDALDAAAAVGDDRIQERTQGQVNPETWTHGSSEQRQHWLVRGINGTGPDSCDTFSGSL
jgi:predicted metalloprotease